MSAMRFAGLSVVCAALLLSGCKDKAAEPQATNNPIVTPIATTPPKTDEVKKTDVVIGTGTRVAAPGDTVWMQYRGTLKNGKEFDSNLDPAKDPLSFTIGDASVIKGWELGIPGMKVGGKRKLEIPPSLGYGAEAHDPIPPNSVLLFDVKLLAIVKPGEENVIESEDLKQGTGREAKPGDVATIRYTGALVNGRVFDEGKKPFTFTIGKGQALPAIEEGVTGMKVGGRRKITSPPRVGFGTSAVGGVPPNSVVVFDVQLLGLK